VIVPQEATATDDPAFVRIVHNVMEGILFRSELQELYVIAIDNWFDQKWLGFSGIGSVVFEFPPFMNRCDAALEEFRQDKITLPAFAPSRVILQNYFRRDGKSSAYVKQTRHRALYEKRRQSSAKNLQRRIQAVSNAALFVWYSSNTIKNDRASMMVYVVKNDRVQTWFVGFRKDVTWKLNLTKGISRELIEGFTTD
jgi:hypothetical protein